MDHGLVRVLGVGRPELVPVFTGLSMRQFGKLVKHSPDTVLIVDGTLVPVHDRGVSASSKNYRYSVNMQS